MPVSLADQIRKFEMLLESLRQAIREGHEVMRGLRDERREVEKLKKEIQTIIGENLKEQIDERINELLRQELDRIGPEIQEHSSAIYKRVGDQADKLINIALGDEFSDRRDMVDLRPVLARQLRKWVRDILESEGLML